jgi:biopolymer transport protein ExbD
MGMIVGKKGIKHDINITPYIDILLVLLIIFMVASPLKKFEEPVRVPQPPLMTPPKDAKPDLIIIDMDIDHGLRINQQPIEIDKLESMLLAIYSRRANKNLFIRGDGALPYGDVFKLLDIAKRSGVGDIALLERNEKKASPPLTASNLNR